MADIRVVITIDDEEQISLRDFGYITDDEFDDKEAITNAMLVYGNAAADYFG